MKQRELLGIGSLILMSAISIAVAVLHFFPQIRWWVDPTQSIRPTIQRSVAANSYQQDEQYLFFSSDEQHVYYLDWLLPGVASTDFHVLGDFLIGNDFSEGLNLTQALLVDNILNNVNGYAPQATSHRGYYFASQSGLFFLRESTEDIPTLKRLETDTKNAHFIDTIAFSLLRGTHAVYLDGVALADVAADQFDIACPEYDKIGRYFRNVDAIYYLDNWGKAHSLTQQTQAFHCLLAGFAKDDSHVYLDGHIISNADPHSFQVFDDSTGYAKDKYQVYYRTLAIPEADSSTFQVLPQQLNQTQLALLRQRHLSLSDKDSDIRIGYDQRHVFIEGQRLDISPHELNLPDSYLSILHLPNSHFIP